jgi:ABC-type multidrug transport system fused ATPase/permease subunit
MRALIGSPSVLLIDEGLSTVDGETASGIFSMLSGYSKRHAVLLVSHQLRTLLRTDYVYVLGRGCVVEEGNPHDLLERQTEFSRLLDFRHTLARSA